MIDLTKKEVGQKFLEGELELGTSCLQAFISDFFTNKIEKLFVETVESVIKDLLTQIDVTLPFDARLQNVFSNCKFTQTDDTNFASAQNKLQSK